MRCGAGQAIFVRVMQDSIFHKIWRSIFARPLVVGEEKEQRRTMLAFFVLHMRPLRLPERNLRFSHTFGLGGMTLVLLFLLVMTGVLLMLAYEATPERAYASIVSLEQGTQFGAFVRSIHYWSANLIVAVALCHLLRVFLTGGIYDGRQFNWVIGLALFGLIFGANFTGYLLPWDQLSYWAVTICTSMLGFVPLIGDWLQTVVRGGEEIGASTLIIFYTMHTTIVPVLFVIIATLHFWRVRKAKGVVLATSLGTSDDDAPSLVPTYPHLLVRELAVASTLIAAVMLIAALFDAGMGEPANPGMSSNPAKAPWFFMGFQEMQLHIHPLFSVVLIPMLCIVFLVLAPYLHTRGTGRGIWFISAAGRRSSQVAAFVGCITTALLVIVREFWLDGGDWFGSLDPVIRQGLMPFIMIVVLVVAVMVFLKRRFVIAAEEIHQALFVLLLSSLVTLTIIGVWFRGPGMALTWPWKTM